MLFMKNIKFSGWKITVSDYKLQLQEVNEHQERREQVSLNIAILIPILLKLVVALRKEGYLSLDY